MENKTELGLHEIAELPDHFELRVTSVGDSSQWLSQLWEKEKQYNLYPGYGTFNFHNQYVQNFAELGCIGFLLLVLILSINLKNAFKNKDFIHIAFTVLMISLFLTESFLWRQRGVVFFTVFYCLFNTTIYPDNKK